MLKDMNARFTFGSQDESKSALMGLRITSLSATRKIVPSCALLTETYAVMTLTLSSSSTEQPLVNNATAATAAIIA